MVIERYLNISKENQQKQWMSHSKTAVGIADVTIALDAVIVVRVSIYVKRYV